MSETESQPDWLQNAEIVSVKHLIVSFTEYKLADGEDAQVVDVNPTSRIRIDSALGMLTMATQLLCRWDDAYLDPEAGSYKSIEEIE